MSIVRAYGSTYKTSTMTKKPTTNALAKKATATVSTTARKPAISTVTRKAATVASTAARNTVTSTAARKAVTAASTVARNANIKAVGGSTQAQRTGGAVAQSAAIDVLKGVGSSLQRNPLKGTDYILKPPTDTTTVATLNKGTQAIV